MTEIQTKFLHFSVYCVSCRSFKKVIFRSNKSYRKTYRSPRRKSKCTSYSSFHIFHWRSGLSPARSEKNPFSSIRLQALCALSNQVFPKWNKFSTLLRLKGAFCRSVSPHPVYVLRQIKVWMRLIQGARLAKTASQC